LPGNWTADWEIVIAADCGRSHAARYRTTADTSSELQGTLPGTDKDTGYCLPKTIADVVVEERAYRAGSVEVLVAGMPRQTPVRATDSTQNSIESAQYDSSVHWTAWMAVGRYFFVVPR